MIQSETYEVLDCIVVDNATSTDYNDCWAFKNASSTLTRNTNNSSLTGKQWDYIRLKINSSYDILVNDYCIEFDTDTLTNSCRFTLYDGVSRNITLSSNKHYKLVITDKIYPYVDGVPQTPINYDTTKSTYQFQLVLQEGSAELQFKNFKLYPI